MFDGRFVNNGWLQEAPDPITKLTWDNAALVSPATAKKLGVELGDVISIERNGRKVEAAVWSSRVRQTTRSSRPSAMGARKSGRRAGNRFQRYRIRTSDSFGFGTGFNVTKAGRKYPLAQTQEFDYQEEPQARQLSA